MAASAPVRVAVRLRPLSDREKVRKCRTSICRVDAKTVMAGGKKTYTFDWCFAQKTAQDVVYSECVAPLLDDFFDGYNATVLAYGQTGTGKTYTMGGEYTAGVTAEADMGVMPRAAQDIFQRVEALSAEYECDVYASYVEVYLETLTDLLAASPGSQSGGLRIREDKDGRTVLPGLTQAPVHCTSDLMRCLGTGLVSRQTGATSMNAQSSRSHAIFTITLKKKPTAANKAHRTTLSQFHVVDLAGSERAKATENRGKRFQESVHINGGLLALGNVVNALSSKQKHIPYRDSKLTRLLRDSLGGNSRTVMVACLSPADASYEESLNTLMYASRARNIRNKPVQNKDVQNALVAQMQDEIDSLRQQLEDKPDAAEDSVAGTSAGELRRVLRALQRKLDVCALHGTVTEADLKGIRDLVEEGILALSDLGEATDGFKDFGKTKVIRFAPVSCSIQTLPPEVQHQPLLLGTHVIKRDIHTAPGYRVPLVEDSVVLERAATSGPSSSSAAATVLAVGDTSMGVMRRSGTTVLKESELLKRLPSAKGSMMEVAREVHSRGQQSASRMEDLDEVLCSASSDSDQDEGEGGGGGQGRSQARRMSAAALDRLGVGAIGAGSMRSRSSLAAGDGGLRESVAEASLAAERRAQEAEARLKELSFRIHMKEGLIRDLVASDRASRQANKVYEGKVAHLTAQVAAANLELDSARSAFEAKKGSPALRKEYDSKLKAAQQKLKQLEQKQKDSDKLALMHRKNNDKLKGLQRNLGQMKEQSSALEERLHQESRHKTRLGKELNALKRKNQRDQRELTQLQQKAKQQHAIIQRKTKEVVAAQRRIRGKGAGKLGVWLEDEVEKEVENRLRDLRLAQDIAEKETLEGERQELTLQRDSLQVKKLRQSQALTSDVLRLSRNLESIKARLSTKKLQLTADGASKASVVEEELADLRAEQDELLRQKAQLEQNLNEGDILGASEERRLLELDEHLLVLEEAVRYRTAVIDEATLQTGAATSQFGARVKQLGAEECRQLLLNYFDDIVELRSIQNQLETQNADIAIQLKEKDEMIQRLEAAVRQARTEAESHLTRRDREAERQTRFLLEQLGAGEPPTLGAEGRDDAGKGAAATPAATVAGTPQQEADTHALQKELYFYKKTSRDLRKRIKALEQQQQQQQQQDGRTGRGASQPGVTRAATYAAPARGPSQASTARPSTTATPVDSIEPGPNLWA